MQRRHLLMAGIVAFAVVGAVVGDWFLSGQQVSVGVAYGSELVGRNVVVSMDGSNVGAFVVPGGQRCSMALIPCTETLGDVWLTRGLHTVHATLNGTTALDQVFAVNGRAYAVVEVFWDGHGDLYVGDTPPFWL